MKARYLATKYRVARWVTADDPRELTRFVDANSHRTALDVVDAPAILVGHMAELNVIQERWTNIQFHALREHGGQVFRARLAD